MGKIRGTPCMRSHICVHRATTKYFSNSFVFKTEIEKEGLPGDITPALGAGGPRFKSGARPITSLFFRNFESLLLMVKSPPLCRYQRRTIQVPPPVRKNGKTVDPTT